MSITVRPLTSDENHALIAARMVALDRAPYFAHALFAVRPLAADGLATFAVDAHWRLYLDPAALTAWGPQVSGGVLIHEVSHLVRDHAGRAAALPGPVDHERWNLATDAAINDDVLAAGIALPEGVVTPQALALDPHGIEEAYYAALPAQPAQDGVGCGSGAGDPTQSWEPATSAPATSGLDPVQIHIARRATADAVRAAGRTPGTVPAGLTRWADEHLDTPAVPWRQVLARAVRRAAALTTGRITYTYARPGRRRLPGILTPALRAPKVRAAVVLDTSGSMSQPLLTAALSEIDGVVKAVGGQVEVIACDAKAEAAQVARNAHRVTLTGGGGTDMRVGIDAALALRPRPSAVIVLTDGYTPWPTNPTPVPLVIAVVGEARAMDIAPDWAVVVHVPTGEG